MPPVSGAAAENNPVIVFFAARYIMASLRGASFNPIFVKLRLMPEVDIPVKICMVVNNAAIIICEDDDAKNIHANKQEIYSGAQIRRIFLLLYLSAYLPHTLIKRILLN